MSVDTRPQSAEELTLINQISAILAAVEDETELGQFADAFMDRMSKVNFKEVNPLVMGAIGNNFCTKIFLMPQNNQIQLATCNLIEFLFEHSLVPAVYAPTIKQRLQAFRQVQIGLTGSKPTESYQLANQPYLTQPNSFSNHKVDKSLKGNCQKDSTMPPVDYVQQVLAQLLNLNAGEKVNKNYGYSLISLNGDFIWCDNVSQKLFEFREKKNMNKNIFDLMIPFSRQLLSHKFGQQLFKPEADFGTSIVFSYVTYSKNSVNKFYKCIKSCIKTEEDFNERIKKKESNEAIYNQYLKALSSRATLVLLKFTRKELLELIGDKSFGLKTKSQFFQDIFSKNALRIAKKVVRRKRGINQDEMVGAPLPDEEFADRFELGQTRNEDSEVKESQGSPKKKRTRGPRNKAIELEEVVCKEAILVETRLAYNTPGYDYSLLKDDPKIKSFEKKILRRLAGVEEGS